MRKSIILIVIFAACVTACKKKDDSATFVKDKISGVSQKGPFLNGSSLTVYELDELYAQTGKSFSTQILDNSGSFELNNISLITEFVKLKADGFYFNEVKNANTNASITLYALSDLSNKSTVNVNMLTNLEVSRVNYLLNNGYTFIDAKKKAQAEILKIFSIQKQGISESELLDISKNSDDDAILLAISLILQGFRSEAELTQLMGDISTDIRTDGILNSPSLGSQLINDVSLFNLPQIRSNLENKFQNLGLSATVSDFEKYINQFIDSTNYVLTNFITYPEYSNYGENILFSNKDTFNLSNLYSMAANLPSGTSIKIIIKGSGSTANWGTFAAPDVPVNWTVSTFDIASVSQVYTSTVAGVNCDLKIMFNGYPSPFTIEYYENNAATPTKVKSIYLQ